MSKIATNFPVAQPGKFLLEQPRSGQPPIRSVCTSTQAARQAVERGDHVFFARCGGWVRMYDVRDAVRYH